MKIVIAGMGGVGGVLGGLLGRGTPDLVFFCRGRTLEAVRSRGLAFRGPQGNWTAFPALATDQAGEIGRADVVFLAVKNYSLAEAAAPLAPAVGPQTAVIPLGNGLEARDLLRPVLPEAMVLGGCVYLSAFSPEPGVVCQAGPLLRLFFGHGGLSQGENEARWGALRDRLAAAGFETHLTADIEKAQWEKFLLISVMATATAFFRGNRGEITGDRRRMAAALSLAEELAGVARASGVDLMDDPRGFVERSLMAFPPETRTSMERDFDAGRPTELESLTGFVVRQARRLGVAAPLYEEMYEALRRAAPLGGSGV